MLLAEGNGGGDGQDCGGVAGALHLKHVDKAGVAEGAAGLRVSGPAVADGQGVDEGLQIAADVQEGRAFGGHQPFVAVAGVEIGVQRGQVQRDVTGGMGAVDDGIDATGAGMGHGVLDGEHQGGGRGDVGQEQDAGAVGDAVKDGLGEGGFGRQRQGDADGGDRGTGFAADIGPGFLKRGIFVVGGQNLITRLQVQRLGDDVQAMGGVGQADQIIGIGAKFGRQRRAGCAKMGGQAAGGVEEGDGLAFKLHLPALVFGEHRARASAIRAVVEEGHLWVKQEQRGQILGHLSAPSGLGRGRHAGRHRTRWWPAR